MRLVCSFKLDIYLFEGALHLQYILHNEEQVVFTVKSNFIKKWLLVAE
jgi:hypothetical protein